MNDLHPLTNIVETENLFGPGIWNDHHVLLKRAIDSNVFPDAEQIWEFLEQPLMRSPYYSVVKEGVWARPDTVTRELEYGHEVVDNIADIDGIREGVAQGASVKLNQMEDWHRPTRDLLRQLQQRLSAEFKAYVFYTPADNTGMRPHRDGSHVLAVQLSGSKRWRIWENPDQIDARAGLDVDPTGWTHEFVMEPGDVLYLPHGVPHAPSAEDGTSLHITITITEPAPIDLCEALLGGLRQHRPQLASDWPRLRNDSRISSVIDGLTSLLEEASDTELISAAVNKMQDRTER